MSIQGINSRRFSYQNLIFFVPALLGCMCGIDGVTVGSSNPATIHLGECAEFGLPNNSGTEPAGVFDQQPQNSADLAPQHDPEMDGDVDATCDFADTSPCNRAIAILQWSNSTGSIDCSMRWRLPNGGDGPVNAMPWAIDGVESLFEDADSIPDGLHVFDFWGQGSGDFTDLSLEINFLGYSFEYDKRVTAPFSFTIALDVLDGEAKVLFNGLLSADESGAGSNTGRYTAEVQLGWRNATAQIDVDAYLKLPSGEDVQGYWRTWNNHGFERFTIPADLNLPDGEYRVGFVVKGNAAFADITFQVRLLNYEFNVTERMVVDEAFFILIRVQSGQAIEIANG